MLSLLLRTPFLHEFTEIVFDYLIIVLVFLTIIGSVCLKGVMPVLIRFTAFEPCRNLSDNPMITGAIPEGIVNLRQLLVSKVSKAFQLSVPYLRSLRKRCTHI